LTRCAAAAAAGRMPVGQLTSAGHTTRRAGGMDGWMHGCMDGSGKARHGMNDSFGIRWRAGHFSAFPGKEGTFPSHKRPNSNERGRDGGKEGAVAFLYLLCTSVCLSVWLSVCLHASSPAFPPARPQLPVCLVLGIGSDIHNTPAAKDQRQGRRPARILTHSCRSLGRSPTYQ